MKLLTVDGNSILNRAFYGVRPLTNKDGLHTNAIFGFLSILQKIQQEVKPDAIAIAFDVKAPTFRHKQYDAYKGQRKGMPPELAQQLEPLKNLLASLGYSMVEKAGWEADDLLGTLSTASREQKIDCVIATGDRDSFQLIGDFVTVRLAYTKGGLPQEEFIDTAGVMEKYGVKPLQLIDVKALMGDASDNIPGVAGVGEKTALSLIQQYQSLDYIYENLEQLEIRDSLRSKLVNGKDSAYMSRDLAKIDCYAPIDTEISHYLKKPVDNASAYPIMAMLELFSQMEKLGVYPPEQQEVIAPTSEQPLLDIQFSPISMTRLEETIPLDILFLWNQHEITAIGIIDQNQFFCIDTHLEKWAKILLTSSVPKRSNELKKLWHYAMDHEFTLHNIQMDAEIAAYILNPTSSDYQLERLYGEYAIEKPWVDPLTLEQFPLLQQMIGFSSLCDAMMEKLNENNQISLLEDIEMPLAEVLASMEHIGVLVDAQGIEEYGKKIDGDLQQVQQEIYTMAGEEFNINSPKQLGVILFEKLGLKTTKKNKTKTGYSTSADVLEELSGENPIVDKVLEYRTFSKLKSTYVDGLLAVVGPDQRIHTTFQQTLTRTGRISSTEPNLQNIPIRTPLGSELRRFFIAPKGEILVDADYSQIELRVLAHLADDKNMISAFLNNEDIHTQTASQVMGLPPELITPLMRSRAKAVNFGIVYGMGAFSLSKNIGVSVSEADTYIKGYLNYYSGVRQYMEDIIQEATEQGYVSTMFHRRRYLPELSSSHRATREFGKRVARNTPIQGTAADIIKIAMIRVYQRLQKEQLKSVLVLQVHDELIVETLPEERAQVEQLVQEEMEHAATLSVPLVADVHAGESWLDAK